MTSNMFQSPGSYVDIVKNPMKTNLPQNSPQRIAALKQGSVGPVMSDLQFMMENEKRQHQEAYNYANGHNDGSAPLGNPSF